jgi:hypothetical protein
MQYVIMRIPNTWKSGMVAIVMVLLMAIYFLLILLSPLIVLIINLL